MSTTFKGHMQLNAINGPSAYSHAMAANAVAMNRDGTSHIGNLQLSSIYAKAMSLRKNARMGRHVRQLISKGRTNPVGVQSGINQTVIVTFPPQAGATETTLAPPGPREARAPKMGNIALIEPDEIGARAVKKTQGASITDVYAFAALNGFPAKKDFLPLGVFANAQDINNPNRDGAGAVQTAGTVLITNHGDETISPGQLVYIDVPDIVNPDGSNRELPLVKELGAHPEMFVPATRPLRWNSERDFAKTIEVELETLLTKKFRENAMSDIIKQMDQLLRNTLMLRDKSPMYNYGMCYGCVIVLNHMMTYGINPTILRELTIYSIDHVEKLGDLANKHNAYTYDGITGKFKRYPSNRITGYLDQFQLDEQCNKVIEMTQRDQQKLACVLAKRGTNLLVDWYTEIVAFYRSKVIGKALDYALPGYTFVIQLGYFHS